MAQLEELRCPEQQCVQPTGLGAPGKVFRPYCGCPTKVCWPQKWSSLWLRDLHSRLFSRRARGASFFRGHRNGFRSVLRPQWAPSQCLPAGVQGERTAQPTRAVALEAGVPFLPPQPRPQRGGQVLCGGCTCPSGSGCRSPRCRGAAGGGLLD